MMQNEEHDGSAQPTRELRSESGTPRDKTADGCAPTSLCPHCHMPPSMDVPCSAELFAMQEKWIGRTADIFNSGWDLGRKWLAEDLNHDGWYRAALLKDRTRAAIRERRVAGESVGSLASDFNVPADFIEHLCAWQMGREE